MVKRLRQLIIMMGLFLFSVPLVAQDSDIITADQVDLLQSVAQIDYGDISADMNIGWFIVNDNATEYIVFDNNGMLYRVSDDNEIRAVLTISDNPEEEVYSVIDGTFAYGKFFILYVVEGAYYINGIELELAGIPLDIGYDDVGLYLETQIDSDLVIYQLDELLEIQSEFTIPSDVNQPMMRVGRIPIPLIVQSTMDGIVDIYAYDNPIGQFSPADVPTVFGSINPSMTHFAWVDPNSTSLNLLDFDSGDNQVVADLNGKYAQYYLLTHDASLVIAVNVDFEPNIIAWDTTTGERYDLGDYRSCERIPDKVEISADGTTLVIGCDTGLDIWRIVEESE